jgi:hypothetical protein
VAEIGVQRQGNRYVFKYSAWRNDGDVLTRRSAGCMGKAAFRKPAIMRRPLWNETHALGQIGRREFIRRGVLAAGASRIAALGREEAAGRFEAMLPERIRRSAERDPTARQLLAYYGAMFVARGVALPPTVLFPDAFATAQWQTALDTTTHPMGRWPMKLQATAMAALQVAAAAARRNGFSITPRASDSGARSYEQTVSLWRGRLDAAVWHWRQVGRLSAETAARLERLTIPEQIRAIAAMESGVQPDAAVGAAKPASGAAAHTPGSAGAPEIERAGARSRPMWFGAQFRHSIFASVAPPGTSQHLSLLAFDVAEHEQPHVRALLEEHGWFQTVRGDLPHFTYLGRRERELPDVGLRRVRARQRGFWIPALAGGEEMPGG